MLIWILRCRLNRTSNHWKYSKSCYAFPRKARPKWNHDHVCFSFEIQWTMAATRHGNSSATRIYQSTQRNCIYCTYSPFLTRHCVLYVFSQFRDLNNSVAVAIEQWNWRANGTWMECNWFWACTRTTPNNIRPDYIWLLNISSRLIGNVRGRLNHRTDFHPHRLHMPLNVWKNERCPLRWCDFMTKNEWAIFIPFGAVVEKMVGKKFEAEWIDEIEVIPWKWFIDASAWCYLALANCRKACKTQRFPPLQVICVFRTSDVHTDRTWIVMKCKHRIMHTKWMPTIAWPRKCLLNAHSTARFPNQSRYKSRLINWREREIMLFC